MKMILTLLWFMKTNIVLYSPPTTIYLYNDYHRPIFTNYHHQALLWHKSFSLCVAGDDDQCSGREGELLFSLFLFLCYISAL